MAGKNMLVGRILLFCFFLSVLTCRFDFRDFLLSVVDRTRKRTNDNRPTSSFSFDDETIDGGMVWSNNKKNGLPQGAHGMDGVRGTGGMDKTNHGVALQGLFSFATYLFNEFPFALLLFGFCATRRQFIPIPTTPNSHHTMTPTSSAFAAMPIPISSSRHDSVHIIPFPLLACTGKTDRRTTDQSVKRLRLSGLVWLRRTRLFLLLLCNFMAQPLFGWILSFFSPFALIAALDQTESNQIHQKR